MLEASVPVSWSIVAPWYGIESGDRARICDLLSTLQAFTDDERAAAMEPVDFCFKRPASDVYRFILARAFCANGLQVVAGYLCYGRVGLTQSTYDLYWLATAPVFAGAGLGRALVGGMEKDIAAEGGGLVRVETGSHPRRGQAVRFYDAVAFTRAAVVPDFYAEGDDLVVFTKRIPCASEVIRRSP